MAGEIKEHIYKHVKIKTQIKERLRGIRIRKIRLVDTRVSRHGALFRDGEAGLCYRDDAQGRGKEKKT